MQTALHPTSPEATPLHAVPRPRDVAREQFRALGLVFRGPAAVAAALAAVATVLVLTELLEPVQPIRFHPEHQMLPGVLGLLLPAAVWRGEDRFGAGFFWTLPVDRRRHALARVFAGWAWLMAAVALFVLWLLALTLLSGGSVFPDEVLRVIPPSHTPGGALDPAAVRTVRWTARPVLWLVPFTAATGTYLLSSALALGARHPFRWLAGSVLGLLVASALLEQADAAWWSAALRQLDAAYGGPYGVDALLTARTESLKVDGVLPGGERVLVWRGLPRVGQWAAATVLWTAAGLAALWAAASRHRESRRP
jgi:hypothetical protein